ncbi:kinase domain protein, putative, partial (macronuclear) [Tetrahymena thermophila SB210]
NKYLNMHSKYLIELINSKNKGIINLTRMLSLFYRTPIRKFQKKIRKHSQKKWKYLLSNLPKFLYKNKKYQNNFQILSFGMVLATKKVKLDNKQIVLKIQKQKMNNKSKMKLLLCRNQKSHQWYSFMIAIQQKIKQDLIDTQYLNQKNVHVI